MNILYILIDKNKLTTEKDSQNDIIKIPIEMYRVDPDVMSRVK